MFCRESLSLSLSLSLEEGEDRVEDNGRLNMDSIASRIRSSYSDTGRTRLYVNSISDGEGNLFSR